MSTVGEAKLRATGNVLEPIIGHQFSIIDEIEPGVKVPIEALSGDHTVGLYLDVIPRKMRDQVSGFREITLGDLRPHISPGEECRNVAYLEAEGLRSGRFRAEWLQYLEDGWWAYVDEVKYPAVEVLGSVYYMKQTYGQAHIYLHPTVPMPLWIRPTPLSESGNDLPQRAQDRAEKANDPFVQIVIQARCRDSIVFTNIHTEVSMTYASRWAGAVHGYYKKV